MELVSSDYENFHFLAFFGPGKPPRSNSRSHTLSQLVTNPALVDPRTLDKTPMTNYRDQDFFPFLKEDKIVSNFELVILSSKVLLMSSSMRQGKILIIFII
jgi:hypothetical protein